MKDCEPTLGDILRWTRQWMLLTRAEVSVQVGIPPDTLRSYEDNRHQIPDYNLEKLVSFYGLGHLFRTMGYTVDIGTLGVPEPPGKSAYIVYAPKYEWW